MTESKSKLNDAKVNDIAQFVTGEVSRSKSAVLNQYVILGIASLILVGYFAYLNSQLKKLTEPENVAKHSVIFLEDNSPDIAELLEVMLKDAAPEIADFMKDQVLQEGVPFLVGRSEAVLLEYVASLSKLAAAHMDQAFSEVVKGSKDSIRKAAVNGIRDADWPANALKPMRENLHAIYTRQTNGRPTEAMNDINKSLVALQNLNSRLIALANKDPKDRTRQEQLGARLLSIYWQYTNRTTLDDLDGKQMPGQGKYAGEGSMDPNNLE